MVTACKDIWLKRLMQDLQVEVPTPIPIYCENLNSMQLAKNPIFHARMKHIEVHYPFMCERSCAVNSNSDWQVADIFTKALGVDKLQHLKGRSTDGIAREEKKAKEKKKELEEGKRGVEEEAELTKDVETSGRTRAKGKADILKRDRASQKKKAKPGHGRMWSRA